MLGEERVFALVRRQHLFDLAPDRQI